MNQFFNAFDAFLATSQTSASADRLNARYEAIIAPNRAAFAGQRVLDIASHDGRWSFAALQAGAAHVVGIEPRVDLVQKAHATFDRYAVAPDRYEFIPADAFEALKKPNLQFDTVLCLGFFYHTIRHCELIDLISRTGASCLIIDTEIVPRGTGPAPAPVGYGDSRRAFSYASTIELLTERVEEESMAFGDSLTRNGQTIVGRPSREALDFIVRHFGYSVQEFDWPKHLAGLAKEAVAGSLVDYSEGWRSTFCCTRLPSHDTKRDGAPVPPAARR